MRTLFYSLGILSLASLTFAFAQPNGPTYGTQSDLRNLSGTFASPKADDWGRGTFGTRSFTFNKGKWTLTFDLALDPQMKNKVFRFRTVGTYKILDKSPTVAHAYNALFLEDKKFVTLLTADAGLAKGFGLADCSFTVGTEKDISETGCSQWKPVKECNQDNDLLAYDKSGKLYFGVRPADNNMCTADKRPTALLPAVIRQ